MPTITIIDNENASLWFHHETGIVHHKFKKYMYGDDFKAVLNQGLEQLKNNGATKWLSDDRGNSALRPEDGEWAETDWAPRVLAAGWRYWAIVLPESIIGKMNMKQFIDRYAETPVTVKVFSDPNEALGWLENVDE
jgi:hypothetical protein